MNRSLPLELLVWITALVILAIIEPEAQHFSLCPLSNLGISWCPGCGIGRSISHLLHLNLSASFQQHWFGIPALLILLNRIGHLSQQLLLNYHFKPL